VIATLDALARRGEIDSDVVGRAIGDLGYDPDKAFPFLVGAQ
jgi:pyruvate dehydrogenase complex dehydrogenase (E1) component